MTGVGVVVGVVRPQFGPGVYDLACDGCGATWSGEPGMACPWCVAALDRQRLEQRRLLLFPLWLADRHGPRYDELDEVDRRIWDRTRGEDRDAGSVHEWARRLGRAVESGLVTEAEADAALERAARALERTARRG